MELTVQWSTQFPVVGLGHMESNTLRLHGSYKSSYVERMWSRSTELYIDITRFTRNSRGATVLCHHECWYGASCCIGTVRNCKNSVYIWSSVWSAVVLPEWCVH